VRGSRKGLLSAAPWRRLALDIMTDRVESMTNTTTYRPKGALGSAQVVLSPTTEYGVKTEWAVELSFQSPTGDMSDFIRREIPCLDKEQAEWIANYWNHYVWAYSVTDLEVM
jgi:hypothetical protein